MKNTYWSLIWILASFYAVALIMQIWLIGISIDLVSQILSNSSINFADHPLYNQFLAHLIPALTLTFVYPLIKYLSELVWNKFLAIITLNLRNNVSYNIMQKSPRDLVGIGENDKIRNHYLAQVDLLMSQRYELLYELAIPLMITITSFVFMLAINWAIGLIALVLGFLPIIIPIFAQGTFMKSQGMLAENEASFSAKNKNYLQGIDTILHYKRTSYVLTLLQNAARSYQKINVKAYNKILPVVSISTFLAHFTRLFIIVILGLFFFYGERTLAPRVTIAIYISFGTAAAIFFGWVTNLINFVGAILGSKALLGPYQKLSRSEVNNKKEVQKLNPQLQNITLQNITFKAGDKTILNNFNYSFQAGEKYLIKGPSGIGKSVLMKIILGLLKPQEGEVLLDGQNLENVDIKSFLKQIHFISHNSFVLNDQITENAFLQEKDKLSTRILRALKLATLDQRISSSEIVIKENELSSGEKQKINFFRFFIENKVNILFLDEAMSNIDTLSRSAIWKHLKDEKDLMVIYISHDENAEKGNYFDKVLTLS